MITFYPRDIELWRKTFDFAEGYSQERGITLVAQPRKDCRVFYDRDELIGFCKEHGVRLNDPLNPFEITGPTNHPVFGEGTFTVKQWTCIGWLKDNFV
jgi:hypothetical protein